MMNKKKKKKRLLLFLCTGNTCRSPMAAGYLIKQLEERKIRSLDVKTAGVMTVDGLLATPEAVQIMDAVGVDLRKHRSRKLTPELIKKAALILGMTPFHVQSALRLSSLARGKTFLLKEYTGSDARHAQISDPMGCTLEVYKRVFGEIKSACNKFMKTDFVLGKKKRTSSAKSKKKKTAPVKTGKKSAVTKAQKIAKKKKSATKKSATDKIKKKTEARKAASQKTSKKKAATKKTSAKKTMTKKKTVAKKPPVKRKTTTKKISAKKAATKKTPRSKAKKSKSRK